MPRLAQQAPALEAARDGRAIHKHVTGDNVTASFVVQTATAIYYDIPEGKQVVIVNLHVGCEDADEFAAAYIVGCSAITGGGTPTQFHAELHNHVGDKKQGKSHSDDEINPPVIIRYSDGHRSVSLAVKATDTATVVDYGWMGWYEDEDTLD